MSEGPHSVPCQCPYCGFDYIMAFHRHCINDASIGESPLQLACFLKDLIAFRRVFCVRPYLLEAIPRICRPVPEYHWKGFASLFLPEGSGAAQCIG